MPGRDGKGCFYMEHSMTEEKNSQDRALGDAWEGWDGDVSLYEGDLNESVWVFLGFAFSVLAVITICLFLFWYLIEPRLLSLYHGLPVIIGGLITIASAMSGIWFLLVVLSVVLRKNLLGPFAGKVHWISLLVRLAQRIGLIFGISKDKLGSSFINVQNILVMLKIEGYARDKVLVLLPRCLTRETKLKIDQICSTHNLKDFIAAGGSIARKIIQAQKPRAIIAVACERDLVSGIEDVGGKIPVIAIPNKRFEGPCKNTTIDFDAFEAAVTKMVKT